MHSWLTSAVISWSHTEQLKCVFWLNSWRCVVCRRRLTCPPSARAYTAASGPSRWWTRSTVCQRTTSRTCCHRCPPAPKVSPSLLICISNVTKMRWCQPVSVFIVEFCKNLLDWYFSESWLTYPRVNLLLFQIYLLLSQYPFLWRLYFKVLKLDILNEIYQKNSMSDQNCDWVLKKAHVILNYTPILIFLLLYADALTCKSDF